MRAELESSKTDTYPVYRKDLFDFNDLKDVIDGKATAIQIPEFFPKEICHEISDRLLKHPKRGCFNKASEIGRIGMAHFEIDGKRLINHSLAPTSTF